MALGVAVAAGAASLLADNDLNVQFHTFNDSRGVTVLSPTADLDKDFTDRTGLKVRFGVDAISAASDSCVRCHPDGANNQRAFVGASLRRKLNENLKLNLGIEYSQERFYRSTTLATSISRSANKGNTTIAGGYAFSWNAPQLHPSQQTENQSAQSAYVAVSHTPTKTTALQFGYQLDQVSGYQANPFLRAEVNGIRELGVTPDQRTRHALTARIRQGLPAKTYIEADYRHYFDSWSLSSDAFSVGLSRHFSPSLLLFAGFRRYGQSGASFYAPEYVGNPQYFTADFRLAPFNSNAFTARASIVPKDGLLGMKPGTGLTFQADFYRADSGFQSNVFSAGLKIPFQK